MFRQKYASARGAAESVEGNQFGSDSNQLPSDPNQFGFNPNQLLEKRNQFDFDPNRLPKKRS